MLTKLFDLAKKFNYILDRTQKKWAVILLGLSFVGALMETMGVSAIAPLIQMMVDPDALMENKYIVKISTTFEIYNSREMLFLIFVGVICIYFIKNAYLLFLSYVRAKYSCKVQRELSVKMMKYYMQRGYLFFVQHNSSELMRGINATPSSIFQVLTVVLRIAADILTVLALCIFIMITDIHIALFMIILILICFIAIVFGFKNMMQRYGKKYHKYYAKATKYALQAFQGIKEVLVMHRQEYFTNQYEKAYIQQQKATVGKTVAADSPGYFIEAVCVAGLLVYVYIQCLYVDNMAIYIPTLGVFAVGAFRILPALGRISSGINTIIFYLPAVQDMYRNFKEVEKNEYCIAEDMVHGEPEAKVEFNKDVVIRDLDWKYPGGEDCVLEGVNLTIHKGESVALIGTSGAGKTTLADILLGLLIPEKGDILVDGKSILHSAEKWGRLIGFVSQAFYLNDDTIRNNIAFGVDEKDIEDERVWRALEQAQLKEFVEGLDNQLDTMLGERGVRFSGGQRQRVAIARALYSSPDILILDEATAALDNETEMAVMEAVEHLKGKVTLIVIAHRLTTIRDCDKVYEVKDGGIWERNKGDVLNSIVHEEH